MRVESANEFHNRRMHVKTREKRDQTTLPRRVRVTLVYENQTKSMRLLRFSGLPCAQVFLKSIKRAFVSESSNGGAVKVMGTQARDERSEQ